MITITLLLHYKLCISILY